MIIKDLIKENKKILSNFARFGFASIGIVYCLLGLLSIMVTYGYKKSEVGNEEVFKTILEQPFGRLLLLMVSIGLLGFVFWRIFQTIKDPYEVGHRWFGLGIRFGYIWSAAVYIIIACYAGLIALRGYSSGDGDSSRRIFVSNVLEQPFGHTLVYITAIGIMVYATFQIYLGFTGNFMDHININSLGPDKQQVYKNAGRLGYISRGIIIVAIGILCLKSAWNSNPAEAQGTEGAMAFLNSSIDPFLMGLIAMGLIAYGMFMFVNMRYADIHV